MPKWTGTWAGGRLAGDDFFIEKMIVRRRHTIKLGAVGEKKALAELSRFLEDPTMYHPPERRLALERAEQVERERIEKAGAVYLSPDGLDRAVVALKKGYGNRRGITPKQAIDLHRYVSEWMTSPALHGREVTAAKMVAQLDRWKTARRNRINNWNSMLRWPTNLQHLGVWDPGRQADVYRR